MAVPDDRTLTEIVIEGLELALGYTPDSDEIAQYKTKGMERVKNDFWSRILLGGDTRLKTLQCTGIMIGAIGRSRVKVPSDFDDEYSVSILEWTHADIATAGGTKSVTLAVDEDITETDAVGKFICMTGGTSSGQYREIVAYDTTTKIALVQVDWDSGKEPVNTDTYAIIDAHYKLESQGQVDLDDLTNPTAPGRPSQYSMFEDHIYFDKSMDKAYPVRLRYYVNLNKVNLTESSTALITQIYNNWQSLLEQGIYARALKSLDDDLYQSAKAEFELMAVNVIQKELPDGGVWEGFEL